MSASTVSVVTGQPMPRRLDLRMASVAIGAWVTTAISLHARPAAAFLSAALLAVVTAMAWWRAGGRRWSVVAALTAGLALGGATAAAITGWRVTTVQNGPITRALRAGRAVEVVATVDDDPRASGARFGQPLSVLPATVTRLAPEAGITPAGQASVASTVSPIAGRIAIVARGSGWRGLLPGTVIRVEGRLHPPTRSDLTAATLNVATPPRLLRPAPWYQQAAGRLRAGLRTACRNLPPDIRGLLPGLVVGDVSLVTDTVTQEFRAAGMSHLTAVSGSNVAMVCGAILALTGWCVVGRRPAALLAGVGLVSFVILVRPSSSVLRSALMAGLGLVALAFGRPRSATPALAVTVLLLVLLDPALAIEPGFVLSVAATAGLVLGAPWISAALQSRSVPSRVADALAVSFAAQAATTPVIAAMTGTVNWAAVPANLLAEPAVAPATILGVLAGLLSLLSPPVAAAVAWVAQWPIWWLVVVARWASDLPGGTLPWVGGLLGAVLAIAVLGTVGVLLRVRVGRVIVATAVLGSALALLPLRWTARAWPPPSWIVLGCDVGQGDAILLRASAPGSAVVVDTGPDPGSVDRCLRDAQVTRVPLLILSHLHADHIGGVTGVLRNRQVGEVRIGPDQDGRSEDRLRASLRAAGLPLRLLRSGDDLLASGVRLHALGPLDAYRGTDSPANNGSLVLRAEVAGASILLPGDIETEAERDLLELGAGLGADILKVPHHGSAKVDLGFLQAVAPRVALIEVGVGNPYGHPSKTVQAALQSAGVRLHRTDTDGDVAVLAARPGLATVARGPTSPLTRPPRSTR